MWFLESHFGDVLIKDLYRIAFPWNPEQEKCAPASARGRADSFQVEEILKKSEDTLSVSEKESLKASGSDICKACRSPCSGDAIDFRGARYHSEHFVCSHRSCQKHLVNLPVLENEGSLYCHDCYQSLFSPKCSYCRDCIKKVNRYNQKL